mmetsp:Transcript_27683/g.70566  ORF Transcript_27683/g.70566 Transcript_27683/m.70566 type:complete len:408 (+) Transcript_27683:99-1322(+)
MTVRIPARFVICVLLVTQAQAASDSPTVDVGVHAGSVPLTLLPQYGSDQDPACLDGSPYGFYFVPSATNSTKWTVSFQGGGWCYDEVGCYDRSQTDLGSSKGWNPVGSCSCMNVDGDDLDKTCNCLYLPYGDGASFSGYRAKPWAVPGNSSQLLTFRGIRNLDASLAWALQHGLDQATEVVVTGGSAGGLAAFLHMDRVIERVRADSPSAKGWGAPVVGYFLDHDNFKHTTGTPNQPDWKQSNYTAWMEYIYKMQNLTAGADGGLTAACLSKHADRPGLCFMSPHMQDVIKSPFFVFNSKYDSWQLQNELQTDWDTPEKQAAVLQYGDDFTDQFRAVTQNPKTGAMITSCICHSCPWTSLTLDGKTTYAHYADWVTGRTQGSAAIHIDARSPNGDGSLTDDKCSVFP